MKKFQSTLNEKKKRYIGIENYNCLVENVRPFVVKYLYQSKKGYQK